MATRVPSWVLAVACLAVVTGCGHSGTLPIAGELEPVQVPLNAAPTSGPTAPVLVRADDDQLILTTYHGRSCPYRILAVHSVDVDSIEIRLRSSSDCSAKITPHPAEVEPPEGQDVQRLVDAVVNFPDGPAVRVRVRDADAAPSAH